jgi:two-component system, chemotaxis family, protein-glutamate methylesterase/glutaminase
MQLNAKLRVLVVDDTTLFRKLVSDICSEMADVEVVGTASNGKIALSRIHALKPDLLTLDIEMPEMNGIEVLQTIRRDGLNTGVIVVSSLTVKGGDLTIKALDLGAFDFVTKPDRGTAEHNREIMKQSLHPLLKAYKNQREIKNILKGSLAQHDGQITPRTAVPQDGTPVSQGIRTAPGRFSSEIIGIGVSTGGPQALSQVLPRLPANLKVPLLIVQHMPPIFTLSLANSLNSKCAFQVKEAENGEPVLPNIGYIAPGGRHMKVALGADATTKIIRVTDDPPENFCKPSVDYLFRSIAHHYLGRSTGVILTGMGSDGTLGLRLMKRNGAIVIAQDEATSTVFGMPKEAIQAGVVDIISPLGNISQEIKRTIG